MRKLLYEAVIGNAALQALVPAGRWIARDALRERPETPFVVYHMQASQPGVGPAMRGGVTFWVHDEEGSYLNVDKIIGLLESFLPTVILREGDGWRLTSVEWAGSSEDLSDDELRTSVRNTSFQVVGRRL